MASCFEVAQSIALRPNKAETHDRNASDFKREYCGKVDSFIMINAAAFDEAFTETNWDPVTIILPTQHGGPPDGVGTEIFNAFVYWYAQRRKKCAVTFKKTLGSIGSEWATLYRGYKFPQNSHKIVFILMGILCEFAEIHTK